MSCSLLSGLSASPDGGLLCMTGQGTGTTCRWSGCDIRPPSVVEALGGFALGTLAEAIVGDRRGFPVVPDVAAERISERFCYGLVSRGVVHGQSFLCMTNSCSG